MGLPWNDTSRLSDVACAVGQLIGGGYVLHLKPGREAALVWPPLRPSDKQDLELPCTYEVACELIDSRWLRRLEINTRNHRLGTTELGLVVPGDYYSMLQ